MTGRAAAAQLIVISAIALAVSGCAQDADPEPSAGMLATDPPAPSAAAPTGVSRDSAIRIAQAAAGDVLSWLGTAPVSSTQIDRFADVRNEFAPSPEPPVADDLAVWTIRLYDQGSGQGATVVLDERTGKVLQVVTFIE